MRQALQELLAEHETRFSAAFCVAVAVHVIVILGVGFVSLTALTRQPVYSLNIALEEQSAGEQSDAAPGEGPIDLTPATPAASDAARADGVTEPLAALSAPGGAPLALALAHPAAVAEPTATPVADQALVELHAASPAAADNVRVKTLYVEDQATAEGYYAENWRLRVQQIATANYPGEARRRGLTGRLTLDVGVRADGAIDSVRVLRSSGVALLDEAALLIVQIAAPYPPFSEELRRRYDVIHIVRTWEFDQDERLIAHEAAADL